MGVSNPVETVIGIMHLLDEVRGKIAGTELASYPWRPVRPESAELMAGLANEALARCEDPTDALIVVTVAAMVVASAESGRGE